MEKINSGVNKEHLISFTSIGRPTRELYEKDPLALDSPPPSTSNNNTENDPIIEEIFVKVENQTYRSFLPEDENKEPLQIVRPRRKYNKLKQKKRALNKDKDQFKPSVNIAPRSINHSQALRHRQVPQLQSSGIIAKQKIGETCSSTNPPSTVDNKKMMSFNFQEPMKLITVQSENDCIVLENNVSQYLIIVPQRVKNFSVAQNLA